MLENGQRVKTEEIDYTYDVFDNLIGRKDTTYNSDGSVATSATQRYVFDGTNMVLAFDGNGNLTDRYLWGPAVDQVLADEHFTISGTPSNQLPSSPGTTLWSLGDNQNTVRDVVTDSGTLEQHIAYSPFGQHVTGTTTGTVVADFAFGYTGTYTDPATALQLHGVRWYDSTVGRWLTEDPSGLGPDSDPNRYCGNAPTIYVDPSGLWTRNDWTMDSGHATAECGDTLRKLAQLITGQGGDWLKAKLKDQPGVVVNEHGIVDEGDKVDIVPLLNLLDDRLRGSDKTSGSLGKTGNRPGFVRASKEERRHGSDTVQTQHSSFPRRRSNRMGDRRGS